MPEIASLSVALRADLTQFNAGMATAQARLDAFANQRIAPVNLGVSGGGVGALGVPDTTSAVAGIKQFASEATAAVGSFVENASAGLRAFGSTAQNVGRTLSVAITAPLVALGAIAVNKAAEVEQSMAV